MWTPFLSQAVPLASCTHTVLAVAWDQVLAFLTLEQWL